MSCLYPLKAYRSREINPETGRRGITFNGKMSRHHDFDALELSCGNCIGCRVDRSRSWAVRCMHEAQMFRDNCFLTLTYDDKHLPADYSVDLEAYQNFLKRLRKHVEPTKIRFFGCAEYGDEGLRPHYHFLIFNWRPFDLVWRGNSETDESLFKSEELSKIWSFGFADVGNLTYQSAAYCARYVLKKVNGELAPDHYLRVHPLTGHLVSVRPEFSTQSRRPGLGSTWLEKFKSDIYPSDFVVVDGKEHPIPQYYTRKLKEEEQKRLKITRARRANQPGQKENNTLARRRVREQVFKVKIDKLKRGLK